MKNFTVYLCQHDPQIHLLPNICNYHLFKMKVNHYNTNYSILQLYKIWPLQIISSLTSRHKTSWRCCQCCKRLRQEGLFTETWFDTLHVTLQSVKTCSILHSCSQFILGATWWFSHSKKLVVEHVARNWDNGFAITCILSKFTLQYTFPDSSVHDKPCFPYNPEEKSHFQQISLPAFYLFNFTSFYTSCIHLLISHLSLDPI